MRALTDFKTTKLGRESVAATEQAKVADARAKELHAKSEKVQSDWNSLSGRYDQLAAAIERACAVRNELQAIAEGGFDQALRASFDWDEREKSKHISVEISKAVGATPIVAKMVEKMRGELLAHANAMRDFAKQNGLPAEAIAGLI